MLRESPAEDTVCHFYPLDSALLSLYYQKDINRDSFVFMRHTPVDIFKSSLNKAAQMLAPGTYLRVSIAGMYVEKEIFTVMPFNLEYLEDAGLLIFFAKDKSSYRLRKDLRFSFQGNMIRFDVGKGGYPVVLENIADNKPLLLICDSQACFAYSLDLLKKDLSGTASTSPGFVPAAGYMLLSKPKYKPGDTLKAYTYQLTGRRGRPLHRKLSVSLTEGNHTLWQDKIKAVRRSSGSYRLNFPIPDSFTLDRDYTLRFSYTRGQRIYEMGRNFSYEDYKLDKAEYDFFLDKQQYKAGDSIRYYISARDENGFAQPFGKYLIDIHVRDIALIRADTYSLDKSKPLYHFESELSGEGLEEHVLTGIKFPPGKSTLMITFKLLNEWNEEKVICREVRYDNTPFEFVFRQEKDSLVTDYLYLRKPTAKQLRYFIKNASGDTVQKAYLITPAKIPIRLDHHFISFYDDTLLLHSMYIEHNLAELLDLQASQSRDSVRISFHSSGESMVYYTIIRNHKVLQADSAMQLDFRAASDPKDRFEITLARESAVSTNAAYNHWHIMPESKRLQIEDNLPDKVLPGESVQVQLSVRDFEGKPGRHVDLSSYGIKSQFKEETGIHYFYFRPVQKDTLYAGLLPSKYNLNRLEPFSLRSRNVLRNADVAFFNLHRIPYYRFYFPDRAFYEEDMALHSSDKTDSTAQLSLQFIHNYQLLSPVWITADDFPIYYSAVSRTNTLPLPFGKHHIRCRVADKELDLGILDFKPGRKKIIGLNIDSLTSKARTLVLRDSLMSLQVDSSIVEKILDHSYISIGLPHKRGWVFFAGMRQYFTEDFYNRIPLSFMGDSYQFFGPYYSPIRKSETKDTLAFGNHAIQFFDNDGKLAKTLAVRKSSWPGQSKTLSFAQIFDTLYYPVEQVPYQNSYVEQKPPVQFPPLNPRFGNYVPYVRDSTLQYQVSDPSKRLLSMAVVSRTGIEKSFFCTGRNDLQYNYVLPAGGLVDLFFEFKDGTHTVYSDVTFRPGTCYYVQVDSLQLFGADKSTLVFYDNVYVSLTSDYKELFTNYPGKVKIGFERSNTGRRSSMIAGRLLDRSYILQDVYLEDQGRFVAGAKIDEQGNFRFLDLSPGNYMIKIHPADQKPLYVYNIQVARGEQYNLSVQVLPEEKPVLISAVNQYFELLVRRSGEQSNIYVYDSENKDLLYGAKLKFLVGRDTFAGTAGRNNQTHFPILQWPSGYPVSVMISADGYRNIWLKNFTTQQGMQYDWKFFMQKKIGWQDTGNAIFINGNAISDRLPAFVPAIVLPDTFRLPELRNKALLHIHTDSGNTSLSSERVELRVYKNLHLLKMMSLKIGQLKDMEMLLDTAGYIIDFFAPGFLVQRSRFDASASLRYDLHLLPFAREITDGNVEVGEFSSPAPPLVYDGRENYERNNTASYAPPMRNMNTSNLESVSVRAYRAGGLNIGGARGDGTLYMIDGQVVSGKNYRETDNIESAKKRMKSPLAEEEANRMKPGTLMDKWRKIFSDESHFVAGLRTDRSGNAFFLLTFPDDVTQWDVHHIAMGKHYFFGSQKKEVNAYKPVMANIRSPRYMYIGDSLELTYHFRNLTAKPKQAFWESYIPGKTLLRGSGTLEKGILDSAGFRADSLGSVAFHTQITTTDSFADRELCRVPIKERAIYTHYDTGFSITDTGFVIRKEPAEEVNIRISHTLAEYLGQLAATLEAYPYDCLEQRCSRLKGLIFQERMARYLGLKFDKKNNIARLIRDIEKSQNADGSFAWWRGGGNVEMTLMAMDALKLAAEFGYEEKCSDAACRYLYNRVLSLEPRLQYDILSTQLIRRYNIDVYKNLITKAEADPYASPFEQLQLLRLKAFFNDTFDRRKIVLLFQQLHEDFSAPYHPVFFTRDPHVLLLRAFRLFRGTNMEKEIADYMNDYIRSGKHIRTYNTYEQALVLENFYEMALRKEPKQKSSYRIGSGKEQRHFPLLMRLDDTMTSIRYRGSEAWMMIDRVKKQYKPEHKDSFFSVRTQMMQGTVLADPEKLTVNTDYIMRLSVFNYLVYEHVMITVPIPSGMSLKHKIPYVGGVEHVEYYSDRIIIYCSALAVGQHDFDIPLRASFRGKCTWPPARAELMYRSEVYGHNVFRELEIR